MEHVVTIEADGAKGARLEEMADDEPWRVVCELPCEARVTLGPGRAHRIVEASGAIRTLAVPSEARAGDLVRVTYSKGKPELGIPLGVVGGLVAVAGGMVVVAGTTIMLLSLCDEGAWCGGSDGRELAVLYWVVGSGIVGLGASLVAGGIHLSKPSFDVTVVASPAARAPTWKALERAPLPPAYATLVDLRF